jgi:stage V sporulation protein B
MAGKSFISGAIVLMAAGFVVRILGFIYRIYLSNLIGAEGMGLFQLIMPLYTLIILTLTAGVSIAVSKMVAEEQAQRRYINPSRITANAALLVICFGASVSLLLYLNAGFISSVLLKDSRIYDSLVLLAPCIPLIAASSALKGYFYGMQQVMPTAVSQIVEQIVKIGIIMALAGYFANGEIELACTVAVAGTILGELSNLAVLAVVYHCRRRRGRNKAGGGRPAGRLGILKGLLKIAAPVSANRFVLSIMSAFEYLLIPGMLVAGGMAYTDSMETYGRLTGMALPLITFPSLVTTSLATTLVPAISEAVSLRNFRTVNHRISKSIQVTFILGMVFTAIFMTYPDEIGNLIYRKERIGDLLYMLSFSCVFIYLQQTLMGVLNGLGRQGALLRNTVIGSAIRIGFVCFMIPVYGIRSYIWGLVAGFMATAALNLLSINRLTGLVMDMRNWLVKPGIVCLIMVFTGKYILSFFDMLIASNSMKLLLTLTVNVTAAFLLMVMAGVLDRDEVLKLAGLKKER